MLSRLVVAALVVVACPAQASVTPFCGALLEILDAEIALAQEATEVFIPLAFDFTVYVGGAPQDDSPYPERTDLAEWGAKIDAAAERTFLKFPSAARQWAYSAYFQGEDVSFDLSLPPIAVSAEQIEQKMVGNGIVGETKIKLNIGIRNTHIVRRLQILFHILTILPKVYYLTHDSSDETLEIPRQSNIHAFLEMWSVVVAHRLHQLVPIPVQQADIRMNVVGEPLQTRLFLYLQNVQPLHIGRHIHLSLAQRKVEVKDRVVSKFLDWLDRKDKGRSEKTPHESPLPTVPRES